MKIQTSFTSESKAKLYVVPTPIGNLDDMTYRAVKVLKEVALIAAEDTRNTMKLLHHYDIRTELISYHEHNKAARGKELLQRLKNGESIAIVSDAGMPAISDPGEELVRAVVDAEYSVVVLPGANAALVALVGSGLSAKEYLFYGFLPRKSKEKAAELKRLRSLNATLLFYESPYRLTDTLSAINQHLGNRQVTVARELTKKFETYMRGSVQDVITWAGEHGIKGECCIVVEGSDETNEVDALWWSHLSVVEHVEHYMKTDSSSSKDAIKKVAIERHLPKRAVYNAYHVNG
ncbi:MAG TPA: 16S rRNA (cytidine(1402)-2'-O)-methyltransferase [Bacillota bacterium]|nr:16S rRNA (cytidine(1402)-2'-O)-methyltransferase [Bacillota bacterium]